MDLVLERLQEHIEWCTHESDKLRVQLREEETLCAALRLRIAKHEALAEQARTAIVLLAPKTLP